MDRAIDIVPLTGYQLCGTNILNGPYSTYYVITSCLIKVSFNQVVIYSCFAITYNYVGGNKNLIESGLCIMNNMKSKQDKKGVARFSNSDCTNAKS